MDETSTTNVATPMVEGGQPIQQNIPVDQGASTQSDSMLQGQETYTEPTNLSEALEQHYAMESTSVSQPVQDREGNREGGQETEYRNQEQNGTGENNSEDTRQHISNTVQENQGTEHNDNQRSGRPTDTVPQFNTRAYLENVDKTVIQQARQDVIKELEKNNVKMLELKDVIARDEESGRMQFINPDTKEPFRDRVSAQQWLDIQNNQVKQTANDLARQRASAIRNNIGPAVKTQIFINTTYQTMNEIEKNVFNNLIEPYAVNNSKGERIGFSCDLDKALEQARSIIGQLQNQNQINQPIQNGEQILTNPPQEKAQPTSPALDMNTGATQPAGEFDYAKEPTNIQEALEMQYKLEERQKGQKNV